jgi:GntR family transcriptional regulator
VAQALNLASGERVYAIQRLRFVNKEAVAVVTSYLPARIFAGIEKQDLEKRSLYDIFERNYHRKLERAEEVIGAIVANGSDAEVLETTVGSALLLIKETTYDSQNVAIEFSVSLLRADRYTASAISVRNL